MNCGNLHRNIFVIIAIFLSKGTSAENPPLFSSTQNCYYTFVVPRDQDGQAGDSPAVAEVVELRHQLTELKSSVTNMEEQLTLLSQLVRQDGGNKLPCNDEDQPSVDRDHSEGSVHFNHWGSTHCPGNTSLIYQGYGAKAVFDSAGSGSEYLCLPDDPDWTGDEAAGNQGNSYVYGVEYWAGDLPKIIPIADIHTGMPCSVCEAHYQHQQLMIPAKTSCPGGWVKQYLGNLMTERYNHASSSNHICVDKQHEKLTGSTGNQPSGYVIPVEVICGSLPCPPYVNGNELSCVVCTK